MLIGPCGAYHRLSPSVPRLGLVSFLPADLHPRPSRDLCPATQSRPFSTRASLISFSAEMLFPSISTLGVLVLTAASSAVARDFGRDSLVGGSGSKVGSFSDASFIIACWRGTDRRLLIALQTRIIPNKWIVELTETSALGRRDGLVSSSFPASHAHAREVLPFADTFFLPASSRLRTSASSSTSSERHSTTPSASSMTPTSSSARRSRYRMPSVPLSRDDGLPSEGADLFTLISQDVSALTALPSVKAVYPVESIPRPETFNPRDVAVGAARPDAVNSHKMTGVDKLHTAGIRSSSSSSFPLPDFALT